MAGGADLFDLQKYAVFIAVEINASHPLQVPALLPFFPQLFARAAPIVRVPRFEGEAVCLLVHVGLHEHFSALEILRDGADEALFVPLQIFHTFIPF